MSLDVNNSRHFPNYLSRHTLAKLHRNQTEVDNILMGSHKKIEQQSWYQNF